MNKFTLAILLVFFKFAMADVFNLSWFIFDPLLACVVIYTFFHNLDVRDYACYAIFCGFLRDLLSLDIFGIYMFSYLVCAFAVATVSSIIYRENRIIVLPVVFFAVILMNCVLLVIKSVFFSSMMSVSGFGWFLLKILIEGVATALLSYFLCRPSKPCVLEFTG